MSDLDTARRMLSMVTQEVAAMAGPVSPKVGAETLRGLASVVYFAGRPLPPAAVAHVAGLIEILREDIAV